MVHSLEIVDAADMNRLGSPIFGFGANPIQSGILDSREIDDIAKMTL
jgi:hypothetical protein